VLARRVVAVLGTGVVVVAALMGPAEADGDDPWTPADDGPGVVRLGPGVLDAPPRAPVPTTAPAPGGAGAGHAR
jgi:hypothetical protein